MVKIIAELSLSLTFVFHNMRKCLYCYENWIFIVVLYPRQNV